MKKIATENFVQKLSHAEISSTTPMRKQTLKNLIYKNIAPFVKGFFHDDSWQPVHKVFEILKKMDLDYSIKSAEYGGQWSGQVGPPSNMPTYKRWKFEIDFINQNNRPDVIFGTITASGNGPVEDVLSSYDLTVVVN
jgi:hypothetical protein